MWSKIIKSFIQMHMVHYRKGISKADIGNTESSVVVVAVLIEVGLSCYFNRLNPVPSIFMYIGFNKF